MKTIINTFQDYNENGVFPELRPFGTGKESGQPYYEFDMYVKGLDRSICLRRGAPSKKETRLIALERLSQITDITLQYKEYLSEREFWEGFDWHDHYSATVIDSPAFRAGKDLKKLVKAEIDKHFTA